MSIETDALSILRQLMQSHDPPLHGLLIPSADAHLSEYVAARDCRRQFISGFSGSAGDALVTQSEALLFVDGRYHTQAEQQADPRSWAVMKLGLPGVPTLEDWLSSRWPAGLSLGVDPTLVSKVSADALAAKLAQRGGHLRFTPHGGNLVDRVWRQRPEEETAPVMIQRLCDAGKSVEEKIGMLRERLRELGAFAVVVSALDEIAWALNVRGWDVQFNPVVMSYLVVTRHRAVWFVDDAVRLGGPEEAELRAHVRDNHVTLRPYDAIFDDLSAIHSCLYDNDSSSSSNNNNNNDNDNSIDASINTRVLIDPRASIALFQALDKRPHTTAVAEGSLIALPKALKNAVEIEGMRQAHLRDGVALVSFLSWLDQELESESSTTSSSSSNPSTSSSSHHRWNEHTVSLELAKFRSRQPKFVSLSFDTICGCGPHGAIIHFKPDEANAAPITRDQVLLIDSGAQFRDGTTDVTRTVFYRSPHSAGPSDYARLCFTRVLQGHIALASAVFPRGTTGFQLDILARLPLWRSGLEYRHGTGHGVGSFLNVHEGPHGISHRIGSHAVALQEGMVVTNEPGFYDVGKFGVRIESVLVVREAETQHNWDGIQYLCFETITVAPLQVSLIEFSLLSPEERSWVEKYNAMVYEKLEPLIEPQVQTWLRHHIQSN